MPVVLRRNWRGTFAALLNFALTAAAGVVVLGNQWVAPQASVGWLVTGGLMLVWSGFIASALLRPVMLVVDDAGLTIRRLLGTDRIGWAQLAWVDFDGSARAILIGAVVGGRDRISGLARRPLDDAGLAAAQAAIRAQRPDLPMTRPKAAGGTA